MHSNNFLTDEYSIEVEKYESTLGEMLWQLINETRNKEEEQEILAYESVNVNISLQNPVSISDGEANECERYDLMTNSDFEYVSQKLTIDGVEHIQFAEYTTGEELENGATEIGLTDSYFEILLQKIH